MQGHLKRKGLVRGLLAKTARAGIICSSCFLNPGLLPLEYRGQERFWEEDSLKQGWEEELGKENLG